MSRRITLRQLEAFRAVMRGGNFTVAARLLHLTQPAVSKLIAELERTLDLELFERSPNGVAPTASAGHVLVELERVQASLDRLFDVSRAKRSQRRQSLRMVSLPVYTETLAPRLLARLMADGGTYLALESAPCEELVRRLLSDEADVGLSVLPLGIDGLIETPLRTERACAVVPSGHRLARRRRLSLEELRQEPFVALSRSSPYRRSLDRVFAARGWSPDVIAEARTQTAVCALVRLGLGVSIIDGSICRIAAVNGVRSIALQEPIEWTAGIVATARSMNIAHVARFVASCRADQRAAERSC